jgi:hypothetical protein
MTRKQYKGMAIHLGTDRYTLCGIGRPDNQQHGLAHTLAVERATCKNCLAAANSTTRGCCRAGYCRQ